MNMRSAEQERDEYDRYLERMHLADLEAIDAGWPTTIFASYGDFIVQIEHPDHITLPDAVGFAFAKTCRQTKNVDASLPCDWHLRSCTVWKVPDCKTITGMKPKGTRYWICNTYRAPAGYREISSEPIPLHRASEERRAAARSQAA